jgi:ATP-dependent Clp protease ATP-binding subunit ClpA
MFDRFSNAAGRVIFLARFEAGRLKFDEIDTPHLLLAFIDDDQGTGALEGQNVYVAADKTVGGNIGLKLYSDIANPFLKPEVAASLRRLLLTIGPRDEPQPTHGDMMLSERAKRVLSDAMDFADKGKVTPLHLFWAMLGDEQGEVADLLLEQGFNREVIEEEIRTRHRR